ncbi:MOP flippase family protein [Massilia sp. H6]|uniref:MOP flippase family protein n=1 Tax=Massilia sp. H6 TaxID=2970464 RepID=UPI002168C5C8|nr:MOP flippase family protein [Massilia sp. H6]UVW28890.1 MOP flippase family protein [Massilia sp. H6]
MTSKEAVVTGVKWTSVSTMGRRVLGLVANIVFARLLAPDDFGLVAMAGVMLGFVDIFKDLGTGAALVREKEARPGLLSSVFWLNCGFGLGMTILMLALSPLVAALYQEPRVQPIVAVMAVSFLLSSLSIVHVSLLTREMAFERLAKVELATSVLSYAIGIGAALLGHGVWSLVYQVIANAALGTSLTWIASRWRPQLVFNWTEIRGITGYSLNLAGYNIFYYFAQNLDNLLIGRFLGTEALGLYDLAYKLMTFPMQAISAVFGRVMMPYYAKAQEDLPRFRQAFLRVAGTIAFVTFPMMFGLLAVREHFVFAVFGAAWAPVIPLLAMFAPLAAIRSVLTTTGSIYMATGHTGLQLRWGMLSNLIILGGLAAGLKWGILGVAAGFTLTSLLLLYPNLKIPFRLIGLEVGSLLRALAPTFACTALMFALVAALDLLLTGRIGHAGMLGVLAAAGGAGYLACTWFLNRAMLQELLAFSGLRKPAAAGLS